MAVVQSMVRGAKFRDLTSVTYVIIKEMIYRVTIYPTARVSRYFRKREDH